MSKNILKIVILNVLCTVPVFCIDEAEIIASLKNHEVNQEGYFSKIVLDEQIGLGKSMLSWIFKKSIEDERKEIHNKIRRWPWFIGNFTVQHKIKTAQLKSNPDIFFTDLYDSRKESIIDKE